MQKKLRGYFFLTHRIEMCDSEFLLLDQTGSGWRQRPKRQIFNIDGMKTEGYYFQILLSLSLSRKIKKISLEIYLLTPEKNSMNVIVHLYFFLLHCSHFFGGFIFFLVSGEYVTVSSCEESKETMLNH